VENIISTVLYFCQKRNSERPELNSENLNEDQTQQEAVHFFESNLSFFRKRFPILGRTLPTCAPQCPTMPHNTCTLVTGSATQGNRK